MLSLFTKRYNFFLFFAVEKLHSESKCEKLYCKKLVLFVCFMSAILTELYIYIYIYIFVLEMKLLVFVTNCYFFRHKAIVSWILKFLNVSSLESLEQTKVYNYFHSHKTGLLMELFRFAERYFFRYTLFMHKLTNAVSPVFKLCFQTKRKELILQSWTKYLREALIFMWNTALRENFDFYLLENLL